MNKTPQLSDFDDFCNLLLPVGALNSPAELHGMLCGQLSGRVRLSGAEWQQAACEFLDLKEDPGAAVNEAFKQLYSVTLAQLESEDFSLELMLPDDDSELGLRAQGLGQWCHGFLTGFGSAGIAGERTLPGEVADALRDLAAIVQIEIDDEDDESESNFMEVAEYVRMAALTLYLECGVVDRPNGSPIIDENNSNKKLH